MQSNQSAVKTIALSGAAGTIGRALRPALLAHGYHLRSGTGFDTLEPLDARETLVPGDINTPDVVDALLNGADVLIHLAGTSVERPLPEIIDNNLRGLVAIYEGARRHMVRRVVFASSNHAFGMHSVEAKLLIAAPFLPDGFYGLSKAWGELIGEMYWRKHAIEGIALRIGTAIPEPLEFRHLSTWLGPRDLVHLIARCIEAPNVGWRAVWGVSANTRSYWDNAAAAAAIGYCPQENAEDFAPKILAQENPLDAVARKFQGGAFVTMDYSRKES